MKTLEEKKLLVKMSRALGQPVDQSLVESIEREERLTKMLFKESKKLEPVKIVEEKVEKPQVLAEIVVEPPRPAPAFVAPIANTTNAALNILHTAIVKPQATAPTPTSQREVEILKRQIAEIMQKITTLSWGGGGTGIVRIWDADDFDRASVENAQQFVTFRDGYFKMDYINPNSIVANTVYVTSNTYQITTEDYYIGVNANSVVTVTLPPASEVYTGREFYVKDESGQAGYPYRYIDVYPTAPDKIDNEDYVRLNINNGGLKFIYRDGWRVL
jgi:hypothetical protein